MAWDKLHDSYKGGGGGSGIGGEEGVEVVAGRWWQGRWWQGGWYM